MMLTSLPFEKAFYNKFNIPCHSIGHTMADATPLSPDKDAAHDVLGIPHGAYCLAPLPGSHGAEVEVLSADFLEMAQLLRQHCPDLEAVVPLMSTKRHEQSECIKAEVAPELSVHLSNGTRREAMVANDAALLVSGTVALGCILARYPTVVDYRIKPFTFWLVRCLAETDYISLLNLLTGRGLVKGLLQEGCGPQTLSRALLPLLTNGRTGHAIYDTFCELHRQTRCNADEQTADATPELA